MAKPFRGHRIKDIGNTGYSTSSQTEGGRLNRKDGSINIEKQGVPFWSRVSLYHSIIKMPTWKFLLCIFLFYGIVNMLFASIYMLVGVEHLQGVLVGNDMLNNFQQAFFFSSQTLTTVGYGHISPVGLMANTVASLESFIGILSFALVTGLAYGRFTRPRAYLAFSDNVLVAPHKGQTALMVRVASYKNNHLTDAEANITAAMYLNENGTRKRYFFSLKLDISRINSLALSWTLVHTINEDSPLYMMTEQDLKDSDIELLYHIKAFDDNFSNIVQQRTSYVIKEFVFGARFRPAFHRSEDSSTTILELDKISDYEPAPLPEPVIQP